MVNRPERLVLVVGTGTEVGKTWVACRLARALRRRGLIVAARKPAQSYDPADDLADTDAALLAHATGDPPAVVCPQPRWYPAAMAPPMAAEALGRPPFTIGVIVFQLQIHQPPVFRSPNCTPTDVNAVTMMSASRIIDTSAPRWRKNRLRTICPFALPLPVAAVTIELIGFSNPVRAAPGTGRRGERRAPTRPGAAGG